MKKLNMLYRVIRSLLIFAGNEIKRGTFMANVRGLGNMELTEEMSWGELLEEKVKKYGDRHFLTFEDKKFSYRDMDNNANRIANFFSGKGGCDFYGKQPAFPRYFCRAAKDRDVFGTGKHLSEGRKPSLHIESL